MDGRDGGRDKKGLAMKNAVVLLLAAASLAASPVLAQRSERPKTIVPDLEEKSRKGEMARLAEERAEAKFDKADEDKDGFVSKDEAAKHENYIAENFERYDKSRDGKLSWEEFVGHDRWKRKPRPAQ